MSFALNFANHLRIEKLQMATVFIIIQWKNADVALVFKKGSGTQSKIMDQFPCCKILEHIISSHIGHHLDQYGILSPYQPGFRKLHS